MLSNLKPQTNKMSRYTKWKPAGDHVQAESPLVTVLNTRTKKIPYLVTSKVESREHKARQWAKENLKEGVDYTRIGIQTTFYSAYGDEGMTKETEQKIDDTFWVLVLANIIKWQRYGNVWQLNLK